MNKYIFYSNNIFSEKTTHRDWYVLNEETLLIYLLTRVPLWQCGKNPIFRWCSVSPNDWNRVPKRRHSFVTLTLSVKKFTLVFLYEWTSILKTFLRSFYPSSFYKHAILSRRNNYTQIDKNLNVYELTIFHNFE